MLSTEEVRRIREEETLRFDIRTELAKARDGASSGSALVKFLNSALGLWILSALFITGGGAALSKCDQERTQESRRREVVEKLDLELSYRFSQILIRLYDLSDQKASDARLAPGKSPQDVLQVVELLRESPSKSIAPLYPDFSAMGIPSLIAELQRQTTDASAKTELEKVLSQVSGGDIRNPPLDRVGLKAGYILASMMLPRWKRGYFYFTDCSKEAPFC